MSTLDGNCVCVILKTSRIEINWKSNYVSNLQEFSIPICKMLKCPKLWVEVNLLVTVFIKSNLYCFYVLDKQALDILDD